VLMGTATIDSMGLVGGKGHTADEYIDMDKIPPPSVSANPDVDGAGTTKIIFIEFPTIL
jgi:hypothetical protein